MKSLKKFQDQLLSVFLILGLVSAAVYLDQSSLKPQLDIPMEQRASNYNASILKFGSLGNHRLVASLLWTHTLLFSDITHYRGKDLNSWMFHRFNTISKLDPKMYENYFYGGQYLSIIKDDVVGAEYIYKKGLEVFPNDLWLNYHSGFNLIFEQGDIESGLKRFEIIQDDPKVYEKIPLLPSIIAKFKVYKGQQEAAFLLLKASWENTPVPEFKERYFNAMYAIRAEEDLACLNQNLKNCRKNDLEGRAYLKVNGKFKAAKKWIPYKLKNKKKWEP